MTTATASRERATAENRPAETVANPSWVPPCVTLADEEFDTVLTSVPVSFWRSLGVDSELVELPEEVSLSPVCERVAEVSLLFCVEEWLPDSVVEVSVLFPVGVVSELFVDMTLVEVEVPLGDTEVSVIVSFKVLVMWFSESPEGTRPHGGRPVESGCATCVWAFRTPVEGRLVA